MKNLILSTAAGLLASAQFAYGLEVIDIVVDVDDGRYRVVGKSRVEASPEFVYTALIDYDNFHKLAGGIAETKYLPVDENGDRLAYTRFESCVLFFCKKVEKIERIDGRPSESIDVEAIPERSDFIFNESRWLIEQAGDATLLTYESEFEPDFWIPPLIGAWAVRRKLEWTAELIGMRIEWMYERGLTLSQVREE